MEQTKARDDFMTAAFLAALGEHMPAYIKASMDTVPLLDWAVFGKGQLLAHAHDRGTAVSQAYARARELKLEVPKPSDVMIVRVGDFEMTRRIRIHTGFSSESIEMPDCEGEQQTTSSHDSEQTAVDHVVDVQPPLDTLQSTSSLSELD